MHNQSLSIDFIVFKKFEFNVLINKEELTTNSLDIKQEIECVINNSSNSTAKNFSFKVSIQAISEDSKQIFTINSELESQITYKGKYNEKISANLAAILYSYLRPMILQFTAMSGFPPLNLPPVNFNEITVSHENKEK